MDDGLFFENHFGFGKAVLMGCFERKAMDGRLVKDN